MEKLLNIDGRPVRFKSTGAFLLRYKSQFKRDALKDIFRLMEGVDTETGSLVSADALDLEVFFNLAWTLAKTADPSIPPPMEWLDSFEGFPLEEVLPEISDMLLSSIGATVEPKKG